MYTKGDFHIHTTASDGICTPKEDTEYFKNTALKKGWFYTAEVGS